MIWDAIIVGGGFYGTTIATYLRSRRGLSRVLLIEQEGGLLTRASATNQARVHNGYHYPRSFTTAFRSRVNLPRFVADYPEAVVRDFTKLYAIARRNSQVTPRHFERFCREIGAELHPAPSALRGLFDPRLVEDVFVVVEYAFNWTKLQTRAETDLARAGVEVRLRQKAIALRGAPEGMTVETRTESGSTETSTTRMLFNCTYSGLNQLFGTFAGTKTKIKHEITEMALVEAPELLKNVGVTLMDGPFFSMMPFPSAGLHSFSHVRYTPHLNWMDQVDIDPYERLAAYPRKTRYDRMVRDAARYIPSLADARYVRSIYEVKTILVKNEADDGRPILFERHPELPNCYSILGSKIDNIYDVLEKLDSEPLSSP